MLRWFLHNACCSTCSIYSLHAKTHTVFLQYFLLYIVAPILYLSFLNLIRTECLDGKHGQSCEEHCSQHCMISGKCDKVTGHCIGGCQAGWKNAQCDQGTIWKIKLKVNSETNLICKTYVTSLWFQIWYHLPTECSGGMFGQHCNQSCGKCLNNEQCHHINGSCLNGCNSGYRGTDFTEGTGCI